MTIEGNNISINRGDTGVIRFVFSKNRIPTPVENRQFRLIIKKNKEDVDSTAIYNTQVTGVSTDVNYVVFTLSDVITKNASGSYYWALRMSGTGEIKTIKEGTITVKQSAFLK